MDETKISRTRNTSNLRVNKVVVHFQKDRLPSARHFYECELGKLTRPNRKGWALGRCPFHESKSGKSFSVNLDSGGFLCFGCDARGGDIISFLRRRDGLSFKEACQQLGAWDGGAQPTPRPPTILVNHLVFDFDVDGVHHRAEVKDEPRTYAQKIRRFYIAASDRLIELRRGDVEIYSSEEENCWAQMVCAVDELRGNL